MPTPSALFAGILFGCIGMGMFSYGKKVASWKPMVAGAALAVYPWFVESTWLLYGVGIAICAAAYVFRD